MTKNSSELKRFNKLYHPHLRALKLQGMSDKTIDVYSRAVGRLSEHFDCVPDKASTEQIASYFSQLIDSHSWSTIKTDRCGLQFFWQMSGQALSTITISPLLDRDG